jgi:hypothetical protein
VLEVLEFYIMETTMAVEVVAHLIMEQAQDMLGLVVWEVVEEVDKMDSLS